MGHTKYDLIEDYLAEICPKNNSIKFEKELKTISSLPYEELITKLKELTDKYKIVLLDDVLYKKEEFEKFDNWFKNKIKPFKIHHFEDYNDFAIAIDEDSHYYSVSLDQDDYWYDWVKELKMESIKFGDGHCYNDLFEYYLDKNFNNLNKRLQYDSENGMFCVYCRDLKDAEEVAFSLATLYKNEDLMISLIKETKEKYGYQFNVGISF